jgi:hypothetical protein
MYTHTNTHTQDMSLPAVLLRSLDELTDFSNEDKFQFLLALIHARGCPNPTPSPSAHPPVTPLPSAEDPRLQVGAGAGVRKGMS